MIGIVDLWQVLVRLIILLIRLLLLNNAKINYPMKLMF